MKNSESITGIILMTIISSKAVEAQEPKPIHGIAQAEVSAVSKYADSYKYTVVLGSKMAYIDEGQGDPILFLHGQPTSSYLWRNIMPHIEKQGRLIAPDNIGFGKSDQPQLDYTFGTHYKYLEAFMDKMDLDNITLVLHDWGSSLGLHYAAEHPGKIKGIVTMEALLAPVLPAKGYDDMPEALGGFFKTVRDPQNGRKLLIDDNAWLKDEGSFMDGFIVRPLPKEVLQAYQAPHKTKKSRIQVNQWPNEIPIAGEPAETAGIISDYNSFLERTNIPWLFLYASPGATAPAAAADYWAQKAKNIETVYIGAGLHYVQEDQPFAIGRAISDWYRRLEMNK